MSESLNAAWAANTEYFEYTSAVNPRMPKIEIELFPSAMHKIDEPPVIPLDLAGQMGTPYPCTGPSLMANFVHINPGESLETDAQSASQVFFCIRGRGKTETPEGTVTWKTGDYFATPGGSVFKHTAEEDTAFYWVNDEPLFNYLGAKPDAAQFRSVFFSYECLEDELAKVRAQNEGHDKNRNGILLANVDCPITKTVTHTMWSLYNLLPRQTRQKAHRHNSIALDLCVSAGPDTYTMIGRDLDADGNIVNPVKAMWTPGSVFVTPPGWWHSHHNDSDEDAIVLPVQDAALHTQIQTLDIQFARGY
jgi:gentisate 1,2-dioxygenase